MPRDLSRTSKPQFVIITQEVQNPALGVSDYLILTITENVPFPFIYLLIFLTTPGGMQDLSSLTRDRTNAPCIGSAES